MKASLRCVALLALVSCGSSPTSIEHAPVRLTGSVLVRDLDPPAEVPGLVVELTLHNLAPQRVTGSMGACAVAVVLRDEEGGTVFDDRNRGCVLLLLRFTLEPMGSISWDHTVALASLREAGAGAGTYEVTGHLATDARRLDADLGTIILP